MKVTVIASIVSLIAGGYIGYKIANDDLQEYIQASRHVFYTFPQLHRTIRTEYTTVWQEDPSSWKY